MNITTPDKDNIDAISNLNRKWLLNSPTKKSKENLEDPKKTPKNPQKIHNKINLEKLPETLSDLPKLKYQAKKIEMKSSIATDNTK